MKIKTFTIMKSTLLGLLIIIFLFSCKEETKIAPIDVKQYSIGQFMDNEAIRGGSFSPDKSKLLVSSNRSGIYNMYTIPTSGGAYTTITDSDSSSYYSVSLFSK